jgi:Zn-dependent peptidase ImmA (M78 family)
VGFGPIPDPITMLELELGLRIFFRPLPSLISGLYAFDAAVGACVLINANHHWKRRVQTAIHETGHFASDRSHADILEGDELSFSIEGRFAKRFGSAFLMPASRVRARFDQIVGLDNRFDVRELILLAHQFGVATEAMCRRLEELTLLPQGSWDSLRDRGFASDLEPGVIADEGASPKPPLISPRLAYLAATALDRELVSEGQLCDLLAVDRLDLREALKPFEAEEVISLYA